MAVWNEITIFRGDRVMGSLGSSKPPGDPIFALADDVLYSVQSGVLCCCVVTLTQEHYQKANYCVCSELGEIKSAFNLLYAAPGMEIIDDFHTSACPDAGSTSFDHVYSCFQRTDSSSGFNLNVLSNK